MSEPHQLYVLIPGGAPAEEAVLAVNRALLDEGGEIGEDADLLLNPRTDDDDPDFEPAGDPSEALARLIAWPALGSITYLMPGHVDLVSFEGGDGLVRAVILSTPNTTRDLAPEAVERYRRIGERLHKELGAARTVMGWALEAKGHDWDTELERAAAGDPSGEFELLDLK